MLITSRIRTSILALAAGFALMTPVISQANPTHQLFEGFYIRALMEFAGLAGQQVKEVTGTGKEVTGTGKEVTGTGKDVTGTGKPDSVTPLDVTGTGGH